MNKKILIIEDTKEHAAVMKGVLSSYSIQTVSTVEESKRVLEASLFDLVILDLNLMDGSGLEVITDKSKYRCQKFIICSGETEISSKIAGFSFGAVDYICKPFNPIELKLRVDRILQDTSSNIIETDLVRLNLTQRSVFFRANDAWEAVDLTNVEFKILQYFMENTDSVLSRDQILDRVFGSEVFSGDRTIDTHISKLRKKLDTAGGCLQSVYGAGYVFKAQSEIAA